MKIFWIVLLVVVLALAVSSAVVYFLQRRRQQVAERSGVAVYATVVSVEKISGRLAKQVDMRKITLRVQEPGATSSREVVMRTRLAPEQKIVSGHKLMVTIDPRDPQRVYPAGPEAAKRVVLTGSRMERRLMKTKGF